MFSFVVGSLRGNSLQHFRQLVYSGKDGKNMNFSEPISIKNEIRAIKLEEQLLNDKYSKYSTSLKVDLSKLNQKKVKLSENERNILNILIEEKTMIKNSLKKLRMVKSILKNYSEKHHNIISLKLLAKNADLKDYLKYLKSVLNIKIYYDD